MFDHDEESKEWEVRDEEPPETLKRKWDLEAMRPQTFFCSSCKKETPAENLTCLFCGTRLSQSSGLLSCLRVWIQRLLRRF